MYDDFQIRTREMTPDDVFAAIVDVTRHYGDASEAALNTLTFETDVLDWELGFDFGGSAAVGLALRPMAVRFITGEEWSDLFYGRGPKLQDRTLGDVCRDVAPRLRMPVIEPVTVMGDTSRAAGAFLAVRTILRNAGVDVAELRPSSPIGPYLLQDWHEILIRFCTLAPGRLPPAHVSTRAHATFGVGILACFFLGMTTPSLGFPPQARACFLTLGAFIVALYVLEKRHVKPANVRIGAARTFRDLCQVLAGERDAWPGFPVVTRASAT